MQWWQSAAAQAAGLGMLAALLYLPTLGNGFVNWDDDRLLLDNPAVTRPDGLARIWSTAELPAGFPNYPLAFTSYWIEHRLWGFDPRPYHALNAALHGVATALACLLSRGLGAGAWVAVVAAALFAAHPLQVEAVAWVAERKTVLAAVFFFAAALAYLRHRRDGDRRWYAASLALFLAALLSKTAMVTLPLSLLLADRVRDGRWTGASLRRAVPYFGLAAAAALLTLHAEAEPPPVPLLQRPPIAARALWFYAGALIAPTDLMPIHPRWQVDLGAPHWWLPLLATLTVAVVAWRRRPWGLGHWGLGHFVATLTPVLCLVPYGFTELSFVAERHAYVASLGLLLLAALGLDWLRVRRGALASVLAAALVVALAARTVRQIGVWRDGETLWQHQLRRDPDSWLARNNLAMALIAQERLDEAAALLERALAQRPTYAEAHNNLALVRYRRGELAAAEQHSRAAAGLKPYEAGFLKNLALTLVAQGQLDAALIEFRHALAVAPEAPDIRFLFADALLRQGQLDAAIGELERTVALAPELIEAQSQLGRARIAAGRPAAAVEPLAAVVAARPDDAGASYNLAVALARSGRPADAARALDRALELNPDFAAARTLKNELREPVSR